MNLVIDELKYELNNIFFYEPIKNTVMEESNFIRIIYSDENIILNGLYIKIENFLKLANNLDQLETNILEKYNPLKKKVIKLKEHLNYILKKSINNNNIYILKISGIWETENCIGLTFKFIYS